MSFIEDDLRFDLECDDDVCPHGVPFDVLCDECDEEDDDEIYFDKE